MLSDTWNFNPSQKTSMLSEPNVTEASLDEQVITALSLDQLKKQWLALFFT